MDYPDKDLNLATDARTNAHVPPSNLECREAADIAQLRAIWSALPAIPKALGSRQDGEDVSWPGFDVRTLLRGEESSGRWSFHSLILSPGAELPAHVRDEGDCEWFVVRGEAELRVAGATSRVQGPAFAFAPAGATQAVANQSSAPVELLLACSPAGTDRAFAAAHQLWLRQPDAPADAYLGVLAAFGFRFTDGSRTSVDAPLNAERGRLDLAGERPEDFAALRRRWAELPATPVIRTGPAACRAIPMPGQETRLMLSPEQSAGQASAFFLGIEPGFGAPPHHQPGEEEFFFVLQGPVRLTVGDRTVMADAGAFAFAPRFTTHAFYNDTEEKLAMFSMNSPGGHERGFELFADEKAPPRASERITALGYQFHAPL